jgi:hypothetical protein
MDESVGLMALVVPVITCERCRSWTLQEDADYSQLQISKPSFWI